MPTTKTLRMSDFLAIPNDDFTKKMETFEKLEDCIENYENISALYGYTSREAVETLYRGVRNAFLYGYWYAQERKSLAER